MRTSFQNQFEQALALFDSGRVEEAIVAFEHCRENAPDNRHIVLNLGHALGAAGQMERAVACYRELLDPGDPAMAFAACWSLADLKGYRFTPEEFTHMKDWAQRLADHPQRFLLMFALARAHEQDRDHESAFAALQAANDQVAASRPFPGQAWHKLADSLAAIDAVPAPSELPSGPTPVFIIGMPRSGSTLVEQILAAHGAVEATSELPFVENLARSLDRHGGFAMTLPRLTDGQCRQGAEAYLGQVKPLLSGQPDFFTDKWPNNFWYVGLIRALFPDAPIINVMRDPLDNAVGVYRQYFSHGNEHSSRLDWAADYWEIYLEVMEHWQALLPGEILHFSYAALVRDSEPAIHRLLDHCGLEFEPGVLRFHETDRPVMTPSGQQVRKPIYRSALDSSAPYRPFIGELLPRFEEIKKRAKRLWERF